MNEKKLACLDLGNTSSHLGIFHGMTCLKSEKVVTSSFIENPMYLLPQDHEDYIISYCSVVPEAEKALRSIISKDKIFCLRDENCLDIPISYPNPSEIGADQLANSIAAYSKYKLPVVIIDIGTATTFDVVSKKGGYEGGVIAPGPQGYLDFLAQNTALLPHVSIQNDYYPSSAIGKNTPDAMLLGVHFGFEPMVKGILENLISELKVLKNEKLEVLVVGGSARLLSSKNVIQCPLLTLEGLAVAYFMNADNAKQNQIG